MHTAVLWFGVLGLLIAPTLVVVYTMLRNAQGAQLYYQGLLHHVKQARLGQLLQKEGVPVAKYIRAESSVEVFQALRKSRTYKNSSGPTK